MEAQTLHKVTEVLGRDIPATVKAAPRPGANRGLACKESFRRRVFTRWGILRHVRVWGEGEVGNPKGARVIARVALAGCAPQPEM